MKFLKPCITYFASCICCVPQFICHWETQNIKVTASQNSQFNCVFTSIFPITPALSSLCCLSPPQAPLAARFAILDSTTKQEVVYLPRFNHQPQFSKYLLIWQQRCILNPYFEGMLKMENPGFTVYW
jgi:hypothetical protein